MATFTVLDLADAQVVARAAGLPPATAIAPIAAGTINSNFGVRCGDARWFVRVNEGKREDDVAWEAELVAALAAGGVPTPVPLAIDGARYLRHRGLLISVFPWIEGAIRDAAAVTAADAAALGQTLGAIHRVARPRWPAHGRAGIYQWPDVVGRLDAIAAAARPELAAVHAELVAAVAEVAAAAPARAAASHGIIHGDLFRDNVLWQADRVVAVLDFEQASSGSLPYDVAVAINDWCWPGERDLELDGARAHALAAAHRAASPWTAADRAALGPELLAAAIRFTITRLTDVYLRQVDNPDKDYRAFLARVRFWRSPEGAAMSTALAHR
ncbi:MAG: phosphotransferase [Myxococcales bacterium]|nr:phosphotransferase [Myxococcales bacterium]MBK7195624.1 phosphotransferase [Myxococcales bacterium]